MSIEVLLPLLCCYVCYDVADAVIDYRLHHPLFDEPRNSKDDNDRD